MTPAMRLATVSVCTAALSLACLSVLAQAPILGEAIPSFEALEAAGAVIGEVRIKPQDIFDEDDPKENNALFRLANRCTSIHGRS